MPGPQTGDVLIRLLTGDNQFTVLDVMSGRSIAGPFDGFGSAVAHARTLTPRAIWQQSVDDRGRVLGDPIRLPD